MDSWESDNRLEAGYDTANANANANEGEGLGVVLIGPLPIANDVIGGTKVSFRDLVAGLRKRGRFPISVINTSRARTGGKTLGRMYRDIAALWRMVWELWHCSRTARAVMWNVSPGGAIKAAPLVTLVCRLRGCPLVVRLFGGDFDRFYDRCNPLARRIVDATLLRSDLLLLQTQALVRQFAPIANVEWFPTTRDMPLRERPLPERCHQLLFIGQLRPEKGIIEILEASRHFVDDVTFTIAGPPMAGFEAGVVEGHANVCYLGSLEPDAVASVMASHDALLLPSYYAGEGYPGVVIEAMQLGLPAIVSDWQALPEIVEHRQSGVIVEPKNVQSLVAAIEALVVDTALFRRLQAGARQRGEAFRPTAMLAKLESWIAAL